MDYAKELITKLENKEARIAVLGLGYVGLPLAVVFAESGYKVTGIDPASEKVSAINAGKSYILDVEDEALANLVRNGSLEATSDFSTLA